MLDSEVKAILYGKFEQDFQKIMKNIKREERRRTLIKVFQYALIPSCAIIILCTIFITNDKNNKTDLLLGKGNNTDIYNIIIDNENINANKTTEAPVVVSKKEIYKTINYSSEGSWAYDPTIPENIIKHNKIPKYVIKVKVTSVEEGKMLPKQENFYNPYTCFTPIRMQVIENLSGNKLSGTIKAYIYGGKIKISNLLRTISNEEAENLGILNISKENQEKYIQYMWHEPSYEPTIGDEYVIIISKINENLYQVSCGGYGIFKVDRLNGQERYINVITNKEWKIQ